MPTIGLFGLKKYSTTSRYILVAIVDHIYHFKNIWAFLKVFLAKKPKLRPFWGLQMPFFDHNGPFFGFKKYSNTRSYMLVTIVEHNSSLQTHMSFFKVFWTNMPYFRPFWDLKMPFFPTVGIFLGSKTRVTPVVIC